MEDIKKEVQKKYAAVASAATTGCCSDSATGCCSEGTVTRLVEYGEAADTLPEGAELGLGCGLPTRYAHIRKGETVLDLGSGAGVDVFLASREVGIDGRVIGVDMTPEMIARAWANAVKGGYTNVDFRLGDIEALPLADNSVDVALSNCVINLAPDKRRVFAELHRVLRKPEGQEGRVGGRFSISDVVTYGPIPASMREDVALWTGCIAGAMDREAYLGLIRAAGFTDVRERSFVEYDQFKGQDYGVASVTVEGHKA